MVNSIKNVDVVISGGGLSGSLLALSLSGLTKSDGSFLSIAIVEKSLTGQDNASEVKYKDIDALFDNRVLALSHGSAAYLQKVGVWSTLKKDACAITDIDISDRSHFGKTRISANEHDVNALGYVVDMALIGKAQLQVLAQKKNIEWFSPDSVSNIAWQSEENKTITIKLSSGTELITSLLLACDGVHFPLSTTG